MGSPFEALGLREEDWQGAPAPVRSFSSGGTGVEETRGARDAIGRMTEHLINRGGFSPSQARHIAQSSAIRRDRE